MFSSSSTIITRVKWGWSHKMWLLLTVENRNLFKSYNPFDPRCSWQARVTPHKGCLMSEPKSCWIWRNKTQGLLFLGPVSSSGLEPIIFEKEEQPQNKINKIKKRFQEGITVCELIFKGFSFRFPSFPFLHLINIHK